ncbi:hypothetical protein BGX26_005309, partial [Mortierella sp. AD094]
METGQQTTSSLAKIAQSPGWEHVIQAMPEGIPESLKDTLEKAEPWQPLFLSSMIVDKPTSEVQQQDPHNLPEQGHPTIQKRNVADPSLFKSLLPDHLRSPQIPASLSTSPELIEQLERNIQPQQSFHTTEQLVDTPISIPIATGSPAEPISPLFAALPLLEPPTDKSINADNGENNHIHAEPGVPPHIPTFNPGPMVLVHHSAPVLAGPPLHFGKPNSDNVNSDSDRGSRAKALFRHSGFEAPGYNLVGLHWIIYIGTQAILVFFLFVLFLGVLILTEYALDLEDDDIANLTHHYWARVVGIIMTTVVSAVHGSLLSGYVIMDGQSDWIAKAAVGATCLYWSA